MTPTPTLTRPASDFEPLVLLHMVREVAEAGGADEPHRSSTRAWDRARPLSDRWPDAPPARRICEHLGLSWEKVRELAFLEAVGQRIALGHALNERQGNWLTPQYCDYALALIARRLEARTLTPDKYRVERERMLAVDRRSTHGSHSRLPTEDQIAALAGTWDRALAHAGLGARHARGHSQARQQALSIIQVLERCYEHYEAEPTSVELHTFAKANGIPVARDRSRTWGSYIEEWKDKRRAAGLPTPAGPPPLNQRWDYTQGISAGLPGERRRARWTLDELIEWVARYLAQLRPRERSRERGYIDWAATQTGAPSSGAFDAHGSWGVVRAAAQESLRERQREPEDTKARAGERPGSPSEVQSKRGRRRRVAPAERLPGRRPTASVGDLVAAGLLRDDEPLMGSYKGQRWVAVFNEQTGSLKVEGEGHFLSLTAAAVHCQGGGAVSGFAFWGVKRDGRIIKLRSLSGN